MGSDASVLTIGRLAEQAECNVPTIRYYEEIGLLRKPDRGRGGQRIYSQTDLRRLTFVRRCRNFDFSIEQIRELIDLVDNPSHDCNHAKNIAEIHLSTVRSKLRELRALEKNLAHAAKTCADQCAGGPSGDCVMLDDFAKAKSCCG